MITFIILCACGLLLHVLKQLIESRGEDGSPVSLSHYFAGRPYATVAAVVGSVALFIIFHEFEQLNVISAFSAGYMGNSAGDLFGNRLAKNLPG